MLTAKSLLIAICLVYSVLASLPLLNQTYLLSFLIGFFSFLTLALSWAVFSGLTGYVSLANSAFFGIGAYVSIFLESFELPVRIIMGSIVSAIAGLPIGLLTLRLKGLHFVVFTFIYNLFFQHLFSFVILANMPTSGLLISVLSNETIYYYLLMISLIALLISLFVHKSFLGSALACIGQDEIKAESIGINTTFYKIITFFINSLFAGAVGSISILRISYVEPNIVFNLRYSFEPVIMSIMGGAATFMGPIIGAVIIQVISQLLITRFPNYYFLTLGALLILFVLFKPSGILGITSKSKRVVVKQAQNNIF